MVEDNDNIRQRDEDNNKRCRGYNERKQGRMHAHGRIGERGARNWEAERGDGKRNSRDKVENAEGKRLMEWIEENKWEVSNGNQQGVEEGEWTCIGSRGGNSDRLRNSERRSMGMRGKIHNRRKSRVGPSPGNKYRRNEP
jgi:hypothetical protein